jgi:leader peptidase (prepilin peptidase) / N-methyltransferase
MWETIILWPFERYPPGTMALVLGIVTGVATGLGTWKSLRDCELTPGWWPPGFGLLGTVLGGGLVFAVLMLHSQSTPEVIPSEVGRMLRLLFHLSCITLLLMITATDLRSFYILDWNCRTGIVIALTGAFLSGELQLAHVWVDWNAEVPQFAGPYIPEWLKHHQHLHGLAWSLAGLLTGAGVTWAIRRLANWVLDTPALGTGDIYLMAMLGAYLGWQPTLVSFLVAPVCGLLFVVVTRLTGNRPALPYGPFLALGGIVTLFTWRWIWMAEIPLTLTGVRTRETTFAVRRFFGDPVAMLLVAGLSVGLLLLLLGLLRLYRRLPVRPR